MNFFQLKTDAVNELNLQLTDFGLQPQDWILQPQSTKKIKIQNRQEKSFFFMGQVEKSKGKAYWKNIHLASL